jgi:aryl-alcohol dehydrogenase-like predicted oxidoreductase
VALAWTLLDPAVTAPLIGARTLAQLEDNLGALDTLFSEEQRARLDATTAIEPGFPHEFLGRPMTRAIMFGGRPVPPR